jgi:hypothetical protein
MRSLLTPLALRRFARLLLAGAFVLLASCAAETPEPQPITIPQSEATPRVLTDLSALGSDNPAAAQIKLEPLPLAPAAPSGSQESSGDTDANLKRLFGETPGTIHYAGRPSTPGKEMLVNSKAQHFPIFCRTLIHQVFVAAQKEERDISFSRERLPREIKPTVISAIMNKDGRLTQLVLEESSTTGTVDQLVLRACKTGLWTNNPPPAALASDGNYRIRVEALITNYNNATKDESWTYSTVLSIALD